MVKRYLGKSAGAAHGCDRGLEHSARGRWSALPIHSCKNHSISTGVRLTEPNAAGIHATGWTTIYSNYNTKNVTVHSCGRCRRRALRTPSSRSRFCTNFSPNLGAAGRKRVQPWQYDGGRRTWTSCEQRHPHHHSCVQLEGCWKNQRAQEHDRCLTCVCL